MLFIQEAIGGIVYGFALGLLFHYLICTTDDHSMELLLTIGVPPRLYAFAEVIHVSGPLAMVVSSIMMDTTDALSAFPKEPLGFLGNWWTKFTVWGCQFRC